MSENLIKNFMRGCAKSLVFVSLFVFSFMNFSQAKMSAKEASKAGLEKFLETLAPGQNVNYSCDGDDRKATCIIKSLTINGIKLQNVQFTTIIDSKTANFTFAGNVAELPKDSADLKDFAPRKVQCKMDMSLRSNINTTKANCVLNADSYTLKVDFNADMRSKVFAGKDMAEILASKENSDDLEIMVKEIVMNFDGARFGEKVFAYMKKSTPDLTREQFNAQVNMFVTSVPLMAAQDSTMTPESTSVVSALAMAAGSVITGKKQGLTISMRPKNAKFVNADKFANEDMSLNNIFKLYDVKVTSR